MPASKSGNVRPYRYSNVEDFWRRIKKSTSQECWPWIGRSIHRTGYAQVRFQGRLYRVHRLAYQLTYGLIPEGKHVCHTCDVRICCNPNHLWLGTNAENVADKVSKNRQRKNLSDETVAAIRQDHANGASYNQLAIKYKINRGTIYKILKFLIHRLSANQSSAIPIASPDNPACDGQIS